jgi:hypothetical protein
LCCFVGGGQKQRNNSHSSGSYTHHQVIRFGNMWYYMEMYRSTLLLSCYLDYMATVPERHLWLSLVLVAWEKERWVLDTRNHHCIVRRVVSFCVSCQCCWLLLSDDGSFWFENVACCQPSCSFRTAVLVNCWSMHALRRRTTTLPQKWIRVLASFCVS